MKLRTSGDVVCAAKAGGICGRIYLLESPDVNVVTVVSGS